MFHILGESTSLLNSDHMFSLGWWFLCLFCLLVCQLSLQFLFWGTVSTVGYLLNSAVRLFISTDFKNTIKAFFLFWKRAPAPAQTHSNKKCPWDILDSFIVSVHESLIVFTVISWTVIFKIQLLSRGFCCGKGMDAMCEALTALSWTFSIDFWW